MTTTNNTPTITYKCGRCAQENHWTLDEIYQFGTKEVMRGDEQEHYSLPCKNPVGCSGRRVVAVPRRKR